MESQSKQFSENFLKKIFFATFLLINFGILLVTVGGGWDITNHLLNKPETFFSPPHSLLYSGVAIALVGTVVMFTLWHRDSQIDKNKFKFSVRLGIIGIFILTSSGPIDFVWHSNFGLDGLLSPPHLLLITGMFLCSIGSMVGILRIGEEYRKGSYTHHHFWLILALLPVWMISSGYIYSFSLPFSQTNYFDFNPEIYFAVILATISLPFLNSVVLILSSKLANYKFGILSIIGGLLLLINAGNSIVPNPSLEFTLPFYFLTIIPFVASDGILAIWKNRLAESIAGGILGSTFFFLYFPLITHTYNEVIFDRVVSASVTANVYFELLPIAYPMVIIPAIIMGFFGTKFANLIFQKI